jgi:hypothetical protein
LAYIQFIFLNEFKAAFVRVLRGPSSTQPNDIKGLVESEELYFTFYILGPALKAKQLAFVSNYPVPDRAQSPTLRHSVGWDPTGKTDKWILLKPGDILTEQFLQKAVRHPLTPVLAKLSIDDIWPHNVLVKHLVEGWMPERAIEFREKELAEHRALRERFSKQDKNEDKVKHFLYFKKKANASSAAEYLHDRGFSTEVRKSGDGKEWLTLAIGSRPEDADAIDSLRDVLESLANKLDGEYDGWEMAMSASNESKKVN